MSTDPWFSLQGGVPEALNTGVIEDESEMGSLQVNQYLPFNLAILQMGKVEVQRG